MRISGPISHRLSRVASRAFWAALVGIHAPLLAGTAISIAEGDFAVSRWGALAILLPSTAFFVLKFADVAWLRWRGRPAAWIAFLLICAVAHHEALGTATEDPLTWQAVSLVTTVGVIRAVRRRAPHWRDLLRRLITTVPVPSHCTRIEAVVLDAPPPYEPMLRSARPPRAPPH